MFYEVLIKYFIGLWERGVQKVGKEVFILVFTRYISSCYISICKPCIDDNFVNCKLLGDDALFCKLNRLFKNLRLKILIFQVAVLNLQLNNL